MMVIFWILFAFVIGTAFGSFVGALTYRLKKGGKLWRGMWKFKKGKDSRSICEHCKHVLAGKDLIPIVSWLSLKGKCRYCGKKIGWTALWLEIMVGAAFVVSYLLWPTIYNQPAADFSGLGWAQFASFGLWLVSVVLLAALFVYDARHKTLPNKLMWPLIAVALVSAVVNFINFATIDWGTAWTYVGDIALALVPVCGVYLVLYVLSQGKWVGFGDVKYGIFVALATGDWRLAVVVLAGANILGTLFVLPQLISKRLHTNSQIAFGPFLILATFITVLCSRPILDFMANYLLV
jgi:prepilin signal peptidase PulO-like enzyme (type II secretory pathway)